MFQNMNIKIVKREKEYRKSEIEKIIIIINISIKKNSSNPDKDKFKKILKI